MTGGVIPKDGVIGGVEMGVNVYIMRAEHEGRTVPGKLFERIPDGENPDDYPSLASISLPWQEKVEFKHDFEVKITTTIKETYRA